MTAEVIDTLEVVERKKTQDQMRELRREIVELRADVATTALALLVGAGKVGKDEAQTWVCENLKTRGSRLLSVGAIEAGQGNYYLDLAHEDYYLAGGEPLARIIHQGA